MSDDERIIIDTARSSFLDMLGKAEDMQAQILSEARSTLAFQFAERLAMEARAALKALELQEAEINLSE